MRKACFVATLFHVAMIGIAAAYHFPAFEIPLYLLPSNRLGVIELAPVELVVEPLLKLPEDEGSRTPPTDVSVGPNKASIGQRQFIRSPSPRIATALAVLPGERKASSAPLATERTPPDPTEPLKRSIRPRRRRQSQTATRFVSVAMATAPSHLITSAPDFSNNRPPEYPATARLRRWEGVVELNLTITAEGRVLHVKITRSSGHTVLDAAAVNAIRGWQVRPAMLGSQAVAVETPLRVRFELP